ncbi:MAG: tRNA (adenosine(37)-N6)-threonylcarbamoyltransferase complex transferase subunit TsaD [Flavobacteriaceae bacterium]
MKQPHYILGIESSCDDTAAAVIAHNKVLSNCIANQKIHEQYGGVVPELASRAHQSNIVPVVDQALQEAGITADQLTAIAYTQGPGLLGSLLVGSSFAKSMALALDIPLIAVNHMQAHLLVHFIEQEDLRAPDFPFIGVTLSGGHTQLVLVKDYFDMELLGTTLDDAIGEAFDKCGKVMGLSYPSGPAIDSLAKEGNPQAFSFPIPNVPQFDVSYSGLKTAFVNFLHKNTQQQADFVTKHQKDLCASLQFTLIEVIMQKIAQVVEASQIKRVVIGGGVSANSEIRRVLAEKKRTDDWDVYIPPFAYTTDNAAMIGIVGALKYTQNQFGSLDAVADPRLKF